MHFPFWDKLRINACGLTLGGSRVPSHRFKVLPDYDLWFIWTGVGEMVWEDGNMQAAPGLFMCLRRGQVYEVFFQRDKPLGMAYLHFDFIDGDGNVFYPPEVHLPPHIQYTGEIEFTYLTMKRITDLARRNNPQALQEAEAHLQGVVLSLYRRGDAPRRSATEQDQRNRIADVLQRVRENPSLSFDIAGLADYAGYTPEYFSQLFRKIHGMPPSKFLIGVRLEHACTLLRDTVLTIEEIAVQLGYADVFFFSRQFKQWYGVAPSKWRAGASA